MGEGRGLDASREAAAIERVHLARARAELDAADGPGGGPSRIRSHGDVLADLVVLKGSASAADDAAGTVAAGGDGDAIRKALAALGRDPERVFYAATRPDGAARETVARRVEAIVEAVDPRAVVALDGESAADLGAAFGVTLKAGRPVEARGRSLLGVSGLEASLSDAKAKARVWRELKALGGPGRGRSGK